MSLAVIVLAAGRGVRMNSEFPKVLHPILNKPMLRYVLDAACGTEPEKTVLVLGHDSELIKNAVPIILWRRLSSNRSSEPDTRFCAARKFFVGFQGIFSY